MFASHMNEPAVCVCVCVCVCVSPSLTVRPLEPERPPRAPLRLGPVLRNRRSVHPPNLFLAECARVLWKCVRACSMCRGVCVCVRVPLLCSVV